MTTATKIHGLIIDGQNDFTVKDGGALFVPGAEESMKRLTDFIGKVGTKMDDLHLTLDSHHRAHIAHPALWVGKDGHTHPDPFTIIEEQDILDGSWGPSSPRWRDKFLSYVRALKTNGRYTHTIWPYHCIIGSWGWGFHPLLDAARQEWEDTVMRELNTICYANTVSKGSNIFTEHFSALRADVPDSEDPATQTNFDLLNDLKSADLLWIAGWADTHCVANTISDIANELSDAEVSKFVFLEDCSDSVPDPPGLSGLFSDKRDEVFTQLAKRGMRTTTSAQLAKDLGVASVAIMV